jgi:hypothetical protein
VENKNFKVEQTKAEDVLLLKDRLRREDLADLRASNSTPLRSLMEGYTFSDECYSVFVGDLVIGMFGFCKFTRSIWFLGSEECADCKKEWLKVASEYINHFLEITPVLTNTVSVENILHIKWLKRMGAKFSVPYYINGYLFQDFYIIKGD